MNNAPGGVVASLAALLACAMIPLLGHTQTPAPGVFTELQTALVPQISPALEPATMRSRVVSVDTQKIAAARQGREVLSLNLFDDAAVQVMIERVRPTRSGYFISGRPQGLDWGEVRLVVNGPVVVGTVVTPVAKFTIRWGGSGRHIIRQIDPAAEPPEHDIQDDPVHSEPPLAPQAASPDEPLASISLPADSAVEDQPTEDGSEIRVLVAYTPAMQARHGGTAGVDALIDLLIQSANQAFEISGINPRLVLAHAALVDYVAIDPSIDFGRLNNPTDGYMDEVHALRNEHAADLIHLLTAATHGQFLVAGLGNVFANKSLARERHDAFALTTDSSEETFTHEIGHNLGVRHDRYTHVNRTVLYPYAFGYVNSRAFEPDAPETARWRTIMATRDRCRDARFDCQRLLRFSNPDQTHLGDPLGVPGDDPATGPDGPADAVRTINGAAPWVGSYRSEACTDFRVSPEVPIASVDGGEVGLQVETAPGCLWEASSETSFLGLASDALNAGPGFVSFAVEANETGEERFGTVTVAGTTIEVRQLATDAGICGRTPLVLQAIAGNRSCDEVTDVQMSQIEDLYLLDAGLTSLKAGDFEGLSALRALNLEHNRLTELPEGVFDGLSDLRRLFLGGNELSELPDGLFAGLSNLQALSLHLNEFSEFSADVFTGLSGLEGLNLEDNHLAALPVGLFTGLSNLEKVGLKGNRLTTLPEDLFSDLSNLNVLDLRNNELSTLPDGLFADLTRLKRIDLHQNQLTSLPNRAFEDLSELETLDLAANQLSNLPDDTFAGLTALQELYLQFNPLGALPEGLFTDLGRLNALYIFNTELSMLPPGMLEDLSGLEFLDISWNNFDEIPPQFSQGQLRLRTLRLSTNRGNGSLSLSAGAFAGLPMLEELDLGNNLLSTLAPEVFSGLHTLQELSLGENLLETLPDGIFSGLTNLKALDLTNNLSVDPLRLPVSLVQVGESQFKAVAPTGAPFTMELPVSVSANGSVKDGANPVAIPVGSDESAPVDVFREALATGDAVTVDIETLPSLPAGHVGYSFSKDEMLPLEIPSPREAESFAQVAGVEVSAGVEQLEVSWEAVPQANGYTVQWKSGDEAYDEARQSVVPDGETTSHTITGLTAGTAYTVRVIATQEDADDGPPSEEVTATPRSTDPDVNGDGVLDRNDALVMNYAYTYSSLVGDGETGGTADSRQRFLTGYSGKTDPTDEDLRAMLRKANAWRAAGVNEGGDINDDGAINGSDANAMYYAYAFGSLLGDGEEGGTARFRSQLLGPLANEPDPTDEDLKEMLRRANKLREEYNL